ncbi:ArsR/SmtB family transcription factor [Thermotoga caldifontis]|uniref:ArsR/SmtB family transcription factor n=1 Tax=Thermotoga caldifontis TaxID=1508419 RepID=UPI0005971B3C|nr:metalloregulator ArsR/SmtB family transcription factor [Thermotoga caldifontis]
MKDTCGEKHERRELVEKIKREFEPKEIVENMVKLLRACADETRLKILLALSKSDLCTCDLSNILSLSTSAISHQLRVLKLSNLVDAQRVGKQVVYRLKDKHVLELISSALEHAKE